MLLQKLCHDCQVENETILIFERLIIFTNKTNIDFGIFFKHLTTISHFRKRRGRELTQTCRTQKNIAFK